jgi:hypothetical protein
MIEHDFKLIMKNKRQLFNLSHILWKERLNSNGHQFPQYQHN